MFSQKDIDDLKGKIYETKDKITQLGRLICRSENEIDEIMDKQEYLENSSRRNNVKILGIPEKDQKTCDKCQLSSHASCNGIGKSKYEELMEEDDDVPWYCIPFLVFKSALLVYYLKRNFVTY